MTMLPMPDGSNPDLGIPPGGLFGARPYSPGPGLQSPNIPQMKQGGMFGGGGGWKALLAAGLAGFTAQSNPGLQQALFATLAQKQRQAQEDAQYQRERQDKRSDFTFEQDYKAANDVPDIQQRVNVLNQIHPGLGDTYAQNYARNGGGLGLVTNAQTGQQYAQPSSLTPPAEAIARLKANPAEAAQFDEIFGAGASTGFLGGPTQPASGGFPGH